MKIANQPNRIVRTAKQNGSYASLVMLAFLMLIARPNTLFGGIVPANCLIDWTPGVSVGVPGGIPTYRTNLINVTQAPYNADKTGVQDASAAIQSAINAATSNQVVYLPAGTYLVGTTIYIGYNNKGITLRGAGTTNTVLKFANSAFISVGTSADYNWSYPSTGNQVTAGLTKGSTTLTMADTSGFSVGGMVQISMANDPSIPVLSVMGYDLLPYNQPMRRQKTRVVSKTATTLNIWPALYDDYSKVTNKVYSAGLQSDFDGIENMYLEMSNSSSAVAIQFEQCYACWVLNVRIHFAANYMISVWDSLNCEVRHCYLDTLNHGGSNGADLLHNSSSADLIEDNIIVNAFPGMEINQGSSGNVFAYNFLQNTNGLDCIDANHAPHNCFNLYEGNVTQTYLCDGYFGSDSQDTIYRNWVNGQYGTGDGVMNHLAWTVALKRFTRSNSIVGNILGSPGASMANDGVSLGQPNMGNSMFTGYGPPWAITWIKGAGTLSVNGTTATSSQPIFTPSEVNNQNNNTSWGILINGGLIGIASYVSPTSVILQGSANYTNMPYIITPESWGYQELDTNVQATLTRVGNFNYASNAIPAAEAIGNNTLSNSLFRTAKPAWFGNLTWPPFDPTNPNPSYGAIPAGYRFVNNGADPPGSVGGAQPPVAAASANPTSGLAPLSVTFSSAGSSDPGGATLTYSWVFGDGGTSTAANPSHTYQSAGAYSAQLTVSDGTNQASASVTITATNVVTSNQPPVAVASANPTSGNAPLPVTFSSAGSSDPEGATLTYSWVFGDGGTSTAANPSYTYQSAGVYSAQLTVSDGTNQTSSSVISITVTGSSTNNGLVAAYGFDEGSGSTVSDSSGNGNTGTINGATWTKAGYFGNALVFNGTNSVTINESPSLDLTTGLTLEAWVMPATNNPQAWMCILYKPLDSGQVAYVLQGASKPAPEAPSLGLSFLSNNLFAPSALPLNTWSHLAGTFDGSTLKLYVNGVQVATQAQTGTIGTSAQPITIGGAWQGLIDEVRVYNRALSASQIQSDMNNSVDVLAPAPPPPTGLRLISN